MRVAGDPCRTRRSDQRAKAGIELRDYVVVSGEAPALEVNASAQALPRGLVDQDETIILMLRPSFWFILLTSLGSLLLIAIVCLSLAYAARRYPVGWSDTQAFGLGIVLAVLRLGWQTADWWSRVYVLTDRRILCRSGVLRSVVFAVPLREIQHTSVFARLSERAFGLGTIGFASAGRETYQAFWLMVKQPFAVQRIILDAVRRYGGH